MYEVCQFGCHRCIRAINNLHQVREVLLQYSNVGLLMLYLEMLSLTIVEYTRPGEGQVRETFDNHCF